MAVFNKGFAPKQKSGHGGIIIGILVAIIVIAVIFTAISNPIVNISSSSTFSLSTNQSAYFMIAGNPNVYSVFLLSASNSAATLYITGTPVLTKTISSITLAPAQSANVSGDGSQIANMQVQLISTRSGYAQIAISQIPSNLQLKTSGSVVLLYPSLPNKQAGNQVATTTVPTTTIAASTTISGSGTTISTISPTTVVSQAPTATIMAIVNSSPQGSLMHNYDVLYVTDQACTSSLYSSTFYNTNHMSPVPPEDFANVSVQTPLNFKITISRVGTNTYNVTYVPNLPSGRTVPFTAIITANVSAYAVSGYVFGEGLNYTTYHSQYLFQSGIGNSCGAYISQI